MLIVTGTKRSGTSMWMQILTAAGFPHLGDAFPGIWEKSIRDANPAGFFESRLRQGIYFATNPDPDSGNFLHPAQVKRHVVKVFIPGLIRTDYAYIGAVVATMRSWREYSTSLQRLHTLEDAYREAAQARGESLPEKPFPDEATETSVRAGQIPPALEWWFENYDLIRDMATRRYHFHMTTYDRLLRDPEPEIAKVIRWLGAGDLEPAVKAVQPALRTQRGAAAGDELVADFASLFDELYATVDAARSLDASFINKLNDTHEILTRRWEDVVKTRRTAVKTGVVDEPDAAIAQDTPMAPNMPITPDTPMAPNVPIAPDTPNAPSAPKNG